jgi:hypothetical protein
MFVVEEMTKKMRLLLFLFDVDRKQRVLEFYYYTSKLTVS